jgi:hypothetical protein
MKTQLSGRMVALLAVWLMSLAVAGMWGHATAQQTEDASTIVFGDDIGFRIAGAAGSGARQGRLMVRIDGKWVDAELMPTMGVRPIK